VGEIGVGYSIVKKNSLSSLRPIPSSLAAKHRMEAAKPKNTRPEIELRLALCSLGINRYKVDYKLMIGVRRKADIAFPAKKIAVFVDGCFWHGCPKHGTWPKANAQFWRAKIEQNKERDIDTNKKLKAAGWKIIRVWEHENMSKVAKKMEKLMKIRVSN
jgi:DNA mismatch endonuclease (patch repair protein)